MYNLFLVNEELKMQKIEITVFGTRMLVDADMVKKMLRKEQLVNEMISLKANANKFSAMDHMVMAGKIASKIIRLNRTIRQTSQFLC